MLASGSALYLLPPLDGADEGLSSTALRAAVIARLEGKTSRSLPLPPTLPFPPTLSLPHTLSLLSPSPNPYP